PEQKEPPLAQRRRGLVLADFSSSAFARTWQARGEQYQEVLRQRPILNPSSLPAAPDIRPALPAGNGSGANAKMLGALLHRFLQSWDFVCEKCSMPALLRQAANQYFAGLGLLRVPFPDPKLGSLRFQPDDPMIPLAALVEEAQEILAEFIGSEAYD